MFTIRESPAAMRHSGNRLKVTIDERGFYLRDTYDFSGSQVLGSWGPDGILRTAVFAPEIAIDAKPGSDNGGQAYWSVSNDSCHRYRDRYHHG